MTQGLKTACSGTVHSSGSGLGLHILEMLLLEAPDASVGDKENSGESEDLKNLGAGDLELSGDSRAVDSGRKLMGSDD